jgi:hypothetical protein
MEASPTRRLSSDVLVLTGCASLILVAHFLMGNGYGFHRDEFQFLDDARHLDFGFVAYPPLTSFAGRIAISLFGITPQVLRLPAAIVNAFSLGLVSLLTRELGGRRPAQLLALCAAFPVALAFSSVLQYNTFDYLAWILIALFTAKLLRTGDERWWLAVGASVGLGILSKYSIAFPAVSLLAAVILMPSQRHHLRTRWLWLGVLAMLLVASPNLVWLIRHHFITLQMESAIHARDVRNGRAAGYFTDQLKFNLFAFPVAVTGLVSLLRTRRFRLLSALYLGPFILLALAKGRGYYLLPGYVALFAAGAVAVEQFLASRSSAFRIALRSVIFAALFADIAVITCTFLPVFPVHSPVWTWQMKNNDDMKDEIGWPELVAQVAAVRNTFPTQDRDRLAILTGNYGEAGALAFFGPAYGLPTPISGTNSFHDRGYGPYDPQTVIAIGFGQDWLDEHFTDCQFAHHVVIPDGIQNLEATVVPDMYVCHTLRTTWPDFWQHFRRFG